VPASPEAANSNIRKIETEGLLDKHQPNHKHKMKEKPTHEVRLGGIKAAIWRNKTESGDTRFSVRLCRIYKDGDAWKSSQSYNRDDLLLLAKVADQVHSWIHQQEQWAYESKKSHVEKIGVAPATR
jgi:hypothetical protein